MNEYAERRGPTGAYFVPEALDPARYRRLWAFKVDRTERDDIGFGFPLIRDGLAYVVHERRFSVRCFDLESGQPVWHQKLSDSVRGYVNSAYDPSAICTPEGLLIGRLCSTRGDFLTVVGRLNRAGKFERLFERKGPAPDIEVFEGGFVLGISASLEKVPSSYYEIVSFEGGASRQIEIPGGSIYRCSIHEGRMFGGSWKDAEGAPREYYWCVIDALEARLLALEGPVAHGLHPESASFAGDQVMGGTGNSLNSFSLRTAKLLWKISTAEVRAGETNEPRKAAYHPGRGWVIYGIGTSIRRERGPLPITAMRLDTREPVWRTETEDHVVLLVTDSHVIGRGGPGLSAYDIETGKRTVLEKKIGAYEAALADGYLVMTTADSVVCARIA